MSEFQKKKLVPMRIPRITAVIKAPLAPSSTLKRILGGGRQEPLSGALLL